MSEARNTAVIAIHHAGTRLALFPWRDAEGPPLLMLHGLYEDADALRDVAPNWPGPVFGLDLSGHGRSAWREGGAYSGELFAADADAALAEIARESDEPVVLAGEGIGAYAALLLAGGRPESVRAAVLAPGCGLEGGGQAPDPEAGRLECRAREFLAPARAALGAEPGVSDPRVSMAESDLRPPDYAGLFAVRAKHVLLVEDESPRPPWWQSLHGVPGVEVLSGSLADAIESFAH